jgi:hypothetical protein
VNKKKSIQPIKSFGIRMKELRELRKAKQIEKIKSLLDPYGYKIRPETQIQARKEIRDSKPHLEIQMEQAKEVNNPIAQAVQRLRNQAQGL